MKFKSWLRKIGAGIAPDSAEMFRHSIRGFLLIVLELLMLGILSLPAVPQRLKDVLDPFLAITLVLTFAIFCVDTVSALSLNSYQSLKKRMNDGFSKLLVLGVTLTVFFAAHESFIFHWTESGKPVGWKLDVTRGAMRFVLPASTQQIDLSFVVHSDCLDCRFIGLLDEQAIAEIYSRNKSSLFHYACSRSQVVPGWHVLRILEIDSKKNAGKFVDDFEFEVTQ